MSKRDFLCVWACTLNMKYSKYTVNGLGICGVEVITFSCELVALQDFYVTHLKLYIKILLYLHCSDFAPILFLK